MSWYVLQCRPGQETVILNSCRKHLSPHTLEEAFVFRCERLWKSEGAWKIVSKEMFPGYVFLQSSHPGTLSRELNEYRPILRVMEEQGYLISVYDDEEENLRNLCGREHFLKMSYGYKDRENGISYITDGPLAGMREKIIRIDWHRRYAQLEVALARQKALVWAGLDIAPGVLNLSPGVPGAKETLWRPDAAALATEPAPAQMAASVQASAGGRRKIS